MPQPHVVVIGGGFGGLAAVRGLALAPVRITLIDKRNHHLFQPLLYQVATAALAPSDIAAPLRHIVAKQANVEVKLAEVDAIDVDARTVTADGEVIAYDHLVVAAGARTSYFGHDGWKVAAPGLKTVSDALEIRHRVLGAFERAEWTTDDAERDRLCTFVVVGGGATGVELAGAIREIGSGALAADFRHARPERLRVVLVEGAPVVLAPFPETLQAAARRQLEALGVEVRTSAMVKDVREGVVDLGDEVIHAGTIVWAAGVRASELAATLGAPVDRGGRVIVTPELTLPDHPEVFVIGDMARVEQPDGSTVPGVAPAAQQMGEHAAEAITHTLAGRPRTAFRYVDKGSLATIGRSKAVADLGRIRVSGFPAWLMWVVVHLWFLVGFRNRVLVFTKWAWQWMSWDGSSRLLWKDEALRDEAVFTRTIRKDA